METELAQQAISFALKGEWDKALEMNLKLLSLDPQNTDVLNRIARAYAETGQVTHAKTYAKKVLNLDPSNTIANKHLEKWKGIKTLIKATNCLISPHAFLEEPGRTKMVELLNIGDKKVIQSLDCGDETKISAHAHKISILTLDGKLIGRLPDDMSNRLIKLMKYGNTYQVLIKSVTAKRICVFIRETHRSPKVQTVSSFKNA